MSNTNIPVLAMYDVRGIQEYIFRTPKLKDAIGASAIVETIIQDALIDSILLVRKDEKWKSVRAEMVWEGAKGPLLFYAGNNDIQVLYIGGGNALVLYRDMELCKAVNVEMSKYVLTHTYSLQLAIAIVEKTDNYANDYKKINREMTRVKANMPDVRPLGALPVMEVELQTGFPKEFNRKQSVETRLKINQEEIIREKYSHNDKRFDNYVDEKGIDSTLAVVHIDGNNMGLRIRSLIEGISDYNMAVNRMRRISYNINHAYKEIYEKMQTEFNENRRYYVLKVLTAGDDITYICTGKIAVATVEYFVNAIVKKTMADAIGEITDKSDYQYSVCAGISLIHSHFPFSIGYKVAEACCESAKDRAKANKNGEKIGNFFDFQICKNVQTMNIEEIRENEFITPFGEKLCIRPYEIGGDENKIYAFSHLRNALLNSGALSRGKAKDLRNIYAQGEKKVTNFAAFLESRGNQMPDGTLEMYIKDGQDTYAKWYDALELMDDYLDLSKIIEQ